MTVWQWHQASPPCRSMRNACISHCMSDGSPQFDIAFHSEGRASLTSLAYYSVQGSVYIMAKKRNRKSAMTFWCQAEVLQELGVLNKNDDSISSVVRGEGHVIRLSLPVYHERLSVANVAQMRNPMSDILNCLLIGSPQLLIHFGARRFVLTDVLQSTSLVTSLRPGCRTAVKHSS